MKTLFRQEALDSFSSAERADAPFVNIRAGRWLLAAAGLLLAAGVLGLAGM